MLRRLPPYERSLGPNHMHQNHMHTFSTFNIARYGSVPGGLGRLKHGTPCKPAATGGLTLRKPYSVRATKAMGTVDMKQPAMGMKEQMNTNSDSSPNPGIASVHIPAAVSAVLTSAMRACTIN